MCRESEKKITLKDYDFFIECDGYYCVVRVGPDGVRRNIAPPGVRTKREAVAIAREERWEMKNEAQI